MDIDQVLEMEYEKESCMTLIKDYLLQGILPERRNEKRQVLRKASRYIIHERVMYRKDFSVPLLRCIAYDEIKQVAKEVHEGECGDHTRGQTLAKKIIRYGYY